MAFIGNTVQTQGFTPQIDYFNGNGSTVTFTLSRPVVSVAQMIVAVDNVIQNPSSAYTVSGSSITFTSAPLSGTNNIWVEYTSLITTYAALSQSPSVVGDITASGGYLAVGNFGASFVDGTIVDYVTGNGRITVGDADGFTIYTGGTSARVPLAKFDYANNSVGLGYQSLNSNAGSNNTAVGYQSGFTNSTGTALTAIGNRAGRTYNTNGTEVAGSTFVGSNAGRFTTSGTDNAFLGALAGYANTTGTNNVAVGSQTLQANTTGSSNTAIGYQSLYTSTNGPNTAVGYQAAYSNNAGYDNTAMGRQALYANASGIRNAAFGDYALQNSTGDYNTAFGAYSLRANTTASSSTAVGYQALYSSTTTGGNTALGNQAGYKNTGGGNTLIGNSAAYWLTTGNNNTVLGDSAGGLSGTALTGNYNTCIGDSAGQSIQSGANSNTFVGRSSAINCTTGSNNICIGTNSGTDAVFNLGVGDNRIVMGYNGSTNAYIKVAWTVTSDARDKTNITPISHGLSFVQRLNPVSYNFKKSREDDTPYGSKRYGFLAQEILALEGQDNVIIDNEDEENLKYQGEALVPVLVKAIQELNAKVTALEAKLEAK